MLYSLKHSKYEKKVIQDCLRGHRPLPDVIKNAPELYAGLEFTYAAFLDLSGDRPLGWTPGPIPWSSIMDYAKAHELSGEETEDLLFFIRRMDDAFLRYHESKTKKT